MSENVLIFDGVRNLCTGGVRFIFAHERDHVIRFVAAQSVPGQALLLKLGMDPSDVTSVVFVRGGVAYVRSDAALEVARHLRLPWRMLRILRPVPRRLRDAIYDLVAQRRYRWFGKRESCIVPTPELRSRLIDGD